jgi:hypothetical protein
LFQLKDEEYVAMSEFWKDVVKLNIGPLVIGVILAIVGWRLNTKIEDSKNEQLTKITEYTQEKTQSIEEAKMKEAREQFWQQKRLDALKEITGECSNMSEVFFDYAGREKVPDKVMEDYANRINKARYAINRNIVLLGPDFDKRIRPYIYLHRKFGAVGLTRYGEPYVEMAGSIENALDRLYQAALQQKKLPHLPLEEMEHKELIKLSPEKYIERQKKYWDDHHNRS